MGEDVSSRGVFIRVTELENGRKIVAMSFRSVAKHDVDALRSEVRVTITAHQAISRCPWCGRSEAMQREAADETTRVD